LHWQCPSRGISSKNIGALCQTLYHQGFSLAFSSSPAICHRCLELVITVSQ
jgi:hypothetical protein